MKRRDFLKHLGMALAALVGSSAAARQAPKKKTNFVFFLKDDLGEKNDLASKMPAKAKELRQMLQKWRKEANVQMPRPNPKYRPK